MDDNLNKQKALIEKLKKGNREVFKRIFNEYYNSLCVYLCSFTNDNQLAEDIVQNTLLKLWENRKKANIHSSIKSYLYKSVYNAFIDSHRKNTHRIKKLEIIKHNSLSIFTEDDNDFKEKRLKALRKAIEELPPKCKEILLLVKYEGYKYKEVAEILNISVNTVENQISKAFNILRKEIKDKELLNLFLCLLNRQILRV